jgi:hypothetical protein
MKFRPHNSRLGREAAIRRGPKGLRRSPAKRLGKAKPREGSLRELKARLETLNARYVKLRDGMRCVQCKADGVPNQGILDAGHLYPKGKQEFKAGHYLVENLFAQCRHHNTVHIDRPEYFLLWFQKEHGAERLEEIHALAVSDWRPDREWLTEQIAERERQIAELEAHYEAMV